MNDDLEKSAIKKKNKSPMMKKLSKFKRFLLLPEIERLKEEINDSKTTSKV